MHRLSRVLLAAASLLFIGLASAAETSAAPLVFVERGLFNTSAAGPLTTVDFESAAANNGYSASLTFSGLQFAYTGPTAGCAACGVGVVSGANFGTATNGLFANADAGQIGVNTLTLNLPSGARSLGFDFKGSNSTQAGTLNGASYTVTVNFADGSSTTTAIANPSFTSFSFFGVTSDVDILSVAIAMNSGGQPILDNVSFGPAAPAEVPEPASMILFGSGLTGLAALARKRRLRARRKESE